MKICEYKRLWLFFTFDPGLSSYDIVNISLKATMPIAIKFNVETPKWAGGEGIKICSNQHEQFGRHADMG